MSPFSKSSEYFPASAMSPFSKASESDAEYLLASDSASMEDSKDLAVEYPYPSHKRRTSPWKILAIVELVAISVLLLALVLRHSSKTPAPYPRVYTPVANVIEYETKRFHASIEEDSTKYQADPSPEVDKLWHDLYAFGVSQLSKEEADKLPMETSEIPGVPGKYIASLSVFHHLHCLNSLRKSLYPTIYPEMDPADNTTDNRSHLNHCVDILRQAVTCNPDVSPLVWQWNPKKNRSMTVLRVPHTCVKWDKIQDWAVENAAEQYDSSIRMEGQPVFKDYE